MAFVFALLASGAAGGTAALVELQVAPRGPGTVSASPAGVDLDFDNQPVTEPCKRNKNDRWCRWGYDKGKTVTLTAKPDGGKSFAGWSTPDCPGTGPCTLTLDDDYTSIVATFDPLELGVRLSSNNETGLVNGKVTSSPGGINCTDDECRASFAAHSRVTLTATPNSGHTFKEWTGCESTDGNKCTVRVDDHPTWVGARFDNDDQVQLPTTISVEFRLRKTGNGSGRVTATKLDCGTVCNANYGFGKPITLTAKADTGSTFDGWNGVCAKTESTCTFPVGPITAIKAVFARDATAPSIPGGLVVRSATRTSIAVSWTAATDNVGVTGYRVYLNDAAVGDTTATEYTFDSLKCGRSYGIAVDATDAVGNRSQRAALTSATQPCALTARLAGVGVQKGQGKRIVVVSVRANRATTARLRLLRGTRVVATGRFAVRAGTNTLKLAVRRSLPGGSYRLTVALVNPDGGLLSLPARGVLLPRPR